MADHIPPPVARAYTPTALPSVTARLLAFVAILLGGLCGGLIGWSIVDLQCGDDDRRATTATARPGPDDGADAGGADGGDDRCTTAAGLGAVVGGVAGAGGVSVVAVLVLRAMAEWRRELEVDEPDVSEPDVREPDIHDDPGPVSPA